MKIITSTGYGGTGSSAVIDYIGEFKNVYSAGRDEFWILQDYHGISDLEYYLIDGNHRSKVNLAIKNFKKYINKNNGYYSKKFGYLFRKISMEYINELTDSKFKKAISAYEINSNFHRYFIFSFLPKFQYWINKVFHSEITKDEFAPFIPEVIKNYSIPDKDRFYAHTKSYFNRLIEQLNLEHSITHVAFDQLVSAIHAERYLNYISNMYIVIVDRDPRDLYLLNQLHWKGASYICNTSNIWEYVSWYKTMREHRKIETPHPKIKYIMLEDFIYNYDSMSKEIANFFELDLNNHIYRKTKFDPEKSKKWTKLWQNRNEFKNEVNIIESELYEYCWQ